jgi:hypothetical protein
VSRMEWNRGLGHAFEEAVRRKPVARWTRALCKLNGAKETCLTDYNNDPAVTFTDLQKSRGDSGSFHQTPGYGGTVGQGQILSRAARSFYREGPSRHCLRNCGSQNE